MADMTQAVDLGVFQWSRPDAENPRLAAPITAASTTITVTDPPLDEDGAVIAKSFLMGIKDANGYVETVYVPSTGISADGLTLSSCVRGIGTAGLDYNTAVTGLAVAHGQDSKVFCNVSAILHQMMLGAFQGTIASGGNDWKIGDGTNSDITIYAHNGDANEPYWFYDAGTSAWYFSNNGVDETAFGTGAGVTGGDGITVTAGDIDIDTTDTTIFKNSSAGAGDANIVPILDAGGLLDSTFLGEPLASLLSAGVTSAEIDQVCDGVSANVTAANLNTMTDGSSNAESLHTHTVTNSGLTSIAMGSVPGSTQVAHGLGVAPKLVMAHSLVSSTIWSHGAFDGSNNNSIYLTGSSSTYAIYCDNAGAIARGVISVDATNITFTWTKVGVGVNIPYILWTALA